MSLDTITFDVMGLPAPQGSKRAFYNPALGRAVLTESAGDKVKSWRQDVIVAARTAYPEHIPMAGPVEVHVIFNLPRPKYHYGTGKNAKTLKPAALFAGHISKPDLDKLARATCDALTIARIYRDDSQIVDLHVLKQYGHPGARITIREVTK